LTFEILVGEVVVAKSGECESDEEEVKQELVQVKHEHVDCGE
jgi:hypothetical protein